MKALALVLLAILLLVLLRRKVSHKKEIQRGAPGPLMNKNIDIPVSMVDPLAELNSLHVRGAELTYLEAKDLSFWYGRRTDAVNYLAPELQKFLHKGYLEKSSAEDSIQLKTVPELKSILADKKLKVSGRKSELIDRIMNNFDKSELECLFPVRQYKLTAKGETELDFYSIIFANDRHALGFPYYRLLAEKEKDPFESDQIILTRLLSQDIQDTYRRNDKFRFVEVTCRTGRFLEEIPEYDAAFDCYVLSFFVWSRITSNVSPHENYFVLNIDRCGKLCGYSLNQTLNRIEQVLRENNPFALTTHYSINDTISLFKRSVLGQY